MEARFRRAGWMALAGTLAGLARLALADSAVIVGAGDVGTWFTTGYLANPSSVPVTVTISPFGAGCPMSCPNGVTLPPLGSESLDTLLSQRAGGFQTLYINQVDATQALPTIRPRLVSQLNPVRSVDIPVVLVSQLMAANLGTLDFAGATLDGAAYSNLVLGNILRTDSGPGENLPVLLELFDGNGARVGAATLALAYGQTVIIGNVVSYLSVGHLPIGLLRITRTGGGALMWGILYTADISGAVTASAGANLLP